MPLDQLMGYVGQIGIPGALCFYVLKMLKGSIDENTKAIQMLAFKMGVNPADVQNGGMKL